MGGDPPSPPKDGRARAHCLVAVPPRPPSPLRGSPCETGWGHSPSSSPAEEADRRRKHILGIRTLGATRDLEKFLDDGLRHYKYCRSPAASNCLDLSLSQSNSEYRDETSYCTATSAARASKMASPASEILECLLTNQHPVTYSSTGYPYNRVPPAARARLPTSTRPAQWLSVSYRNPSASHGPGTAHAPLLPAQQSPAGALKVAERSACSHPTKAIRVQSSTGHSPDFRTWESCRTMPLVGGFSRGSPVSPTLSLRRCSILTLITLIGFQDLDSCNNHLFCDLSTRPAKLHHQPGKMVGTAFGNRRPGNLLASRHGSPANRVANQAQGPFPEPCVVDNRTCTSIRRYRHAISQSADTGIYWRGKREIPEKNPPTSGIIRHDSRMRNSGSNPAGNRTRAISALHTYILCNYKGTLTTQVVEAASLEPTWRRQDTPSTQSANVSELPVGVQNCHDSGARNTAAA
ncbi:hypothetical protein PR048_007982 [Dryococelus australis]|uniref:Uncharacterized protein n=1 Tax=Dryococelus australis TaxID=614101 RepID=A0ABQ9HVU1_9NEOP|nr:hypothetical protein PR048_007982 [Dryococelus australis]